MMADTFSQIYIQTVFAVQGRQSLISDQNKNELYKYITGIVTNKGQKLIRINGMPDHIHILIGLKPAMALSDLVRDIKTNSSTFVNDKRWFRGKFNWQEGYGAFSYGHSQLDRVIRYIDNQEIHHRTTTFREEYLKLLKRFNIKFKDEYLFEWIE
jgi:REP element-mobilizing transposase RayT